MVTRAPAPGPRPLVLRGEDCPSLINGYLPAAGEGKTFFLHPAPSRCLLLGAFFLVLAAGALFLDMPARQWSGERLPGDLMRLLTWSELFAHGLGASLLVLVVYVLDPSRRRCVPRLIVSALGAGVAADLVKLMVARVRPHHFSGTTVVESFVGWMPVFRSFEGFEWCDHRLQSFPSAHTAVAIGLAMGLTTLYPHGRYLFASFAGLAAAQRWAAGAHYVSDVLAGAAVGCFFAVAVGPGGWLARPFYRWEAKRNTAADLASGSDA